MPGISDLPVEVFEFVVAELPSSSLASALRINSHFYTLALRVLYRTINQDVIKDFNLARSLRFLESITTHAFAFGVRNPFNLVQTLHLDFARNRVTANLLRLIQRALHKLTALKELSLEFSLHDNHYPISWLLEGCTFQLRMLATSLRCDQQLANFLERQINLRELCLRGFQTTAPFVLSSEALPKLTSFRAVHAGVPVLEAIIKDRMIESVSLSLFMEDGFAPLDTLKLSKARIKRLTIMSLDTTTPATLIPEVTARAPHLEALHIVVLMARYDEETLLATTQCLRPFKGLRYLTLMTGGTPPDSGDESVVTRAWAKACPTLRTIILPQGKVWFERNGNWLCCA
ncbi:hypothetical protein BXZ70DRAFT_516798 [Cristinia sonorae]|uniref:F-box domain-containing protein n=1 Tax=Cristinia sonorae TaxID=1940300 RepID=A0A8K0UW98_9AGAR|nr:hypothetical protein BXZ70DRAFT_516798 [Cristinia sonorae]